MSGIFGIVAKKNCAQDLFYLGDYHSHLGTQFAGIAAWNHQLIRKIHDISKSQFKAKIADDVKGLKANKAIGAIANEEQPVYVKSKFGDFCIVSNGWINNWEVLAGELLRKGHSFSEFSAPVMNITELFSKLIIQKSSLIKGIEYAFSRIDGSLSVLILTKDGLYAVSDKAGVFPLIIGKKKNSRAVVTETTAFPNLGFEVERYLAPGEIVLITESGTKEKGRAASHCRICSFLWIYTGFPASSYEGINVEVVREKSGRFLAKNDDIEPDFACGVPDSGTAHAIGYAMEKNIPHRRPLVKYTPGYGRSYLPPSQSVRDLVAKMKLVPIKDIIKGSRIAICDDSIVRGTQLKNFTIAKLWKNEAKEIHVRVACPPLMHPCRFNVSTRSIKELAARRAIRALEGKDIADVSRYIDEGSSQHEKMVEWIRKDIGVTSLRYQKLYDMIAAIGISKDRLCTYCWTGKA